MTRVLPASALVAASFGPACARTAVEGVVVDAAGQPLPGAAVAIDGTACAALTREDGGFSLPCDPGDLVVSISLAGYTPARVEVAARELRDYDLGKRVLIKIPDAPGLYLLDRSACRDLEDARLYKALERDGRLTRRSFCVDGEASAINEVAAGVVELFDYEHPGWRPFRLDAAECAYRDTRNQAHQWKIEYRAKPEFEVADVAPGIVVARFELEAGDYFVAEWRGFFVPEQDDAHRYGGYWIRAR